MLVKQLSSSLTFSGRSSTAIVALLGAVAIWGFNILVVMEAVTVWPQIPFIAVRFWIATLAFIPFLDRDRMRDLCADGRVFRTAITAGAALFLAYVLQATGFKDTSIANGAFLTALFVIFVPIIQATVSRRLPPLHELAGCIVASVGTAILVGGAWALPQRAEVLVIGSAIMYACQIVIVGSMPTRVRSIDFTVIQLATIAVGATAASIPAVIAGVVPMPSETLLIDALFAGLFASSLAYFLQAFAQRRLTTAQAAVIFTLEPVFAVMAGVALAQDAASLRTIVGGAVIVGATILCTHPYFMRRAELRVEASCGSTEPQH